MTPRLSKTCLALATLMASWCGVAIAHEGDLKLRDFKGAVQAPAWLADEADPMAEAAPTFQSNGVRLMAWFPVNTFNSSNTSGNDVWGYVSPSGREYGLMGLSHGTGFVEVTNPGSSRIIAFIAGPSSLWRNVKTYQSYAYSVSEGGGGIQVFDLSNIDNGVVTLVNTVDAGAATPATHTMIINEQTGYLYRMGGGSNGLRIYTLKPTATAPSASATNPVLVASWTTKYTHDGAVFNWTTGPYAGKEIFFACGGLNGGQTDTGVDIIDVTNKSAITVIGRFTYSNANFCHQLWLSQDRRYAYINDELDEGNRGLYNVGRIMDIANLASPVAAGTYTTGIRSVDHNEYVHNNLLFCSNYTSGLQIFDLTNPASPQRTAWFDTHPDDDANPVATFNGLWSNYPYLPSGTILGSDIERGMFVLRLGAEPATVSLFGPVRTEFDPRGQGIQVDVATNPGISVTPEGVVLRTTVAGVTTDTALQQVSATRWGGRTPPYACGAEIEWNVEAFVSDGTSVKYPAAGTLRALAASSNEVTLSDFCEASTGWTVGATGDNATAGLWVNADPVFTAAQPEDDRSVNGTRCWVTGNGAVNGALGAADLDGGTTTLTSPAYSVAGLSDPYISYARWYSNNQGADPNNDSMPIQISGNGGSTWVQLELVTENAGAWVDKQFRVRDFVTPTANTVRLRFIARDLGAGSVVEAAVDDVQVRDLQCPTGADGDLDGDGVVGGGDLAIMLLDFGDCPGCVADLDGSGTVDGGDIAFLLLLFG
ncbi:MAG: choice-of-anchor B family protein [Phycisphaerales bacterium]